MHSATIPEALEKFQIPLKKGSQECPFCGKKNKFHISETYFKCYSCNLYGDTQDLLVKLQICSSREKAFGLLNENSSEFYSQRNKRIKILSKAFEIYRDFYEKSDNEKKVLDWGLERGLTRLGKVELGYASSQSLTKFFKNEELKQAGLMTLKSHELFSNRIVFPIRDYDSEIVHFQSRALNPKEELRWVATSSVEYYPISHYLYNPNYSDKSGVILCEGITDSLSINELGLPYAGTFGIETKLTRFTKFFKNKAHLVLFYDNNLYPQGVKRGGQYKSWVSVLNAAAELYRALPEVRISCITPPEEIGDDINDWLNHKETPLTREQCLSSIKAADRIEDFAFKHLSEFESCHRLLIKIISIKREPKDIEKLEQTINYKRILELWNQFS